MRPLGACLKALLEVCSGSVGLDETSALLLDPAGQRELDLAVVHLLDERTSGLVGVHSLHSDDLDGVGPGPVPGPHVPVALGDGPADGEVSVLAVHVVGSRPGVVSQPDPEVLDLLHGDDLSSGLLKFPQLSQEVPEARLGHNGIRGEDSHPVERSLRLILSWLLTTNHAEFSKSSFCLHFISCRSESSNISLVVSSQLRMSR